MQLHPKGLIQSGRSEDPLMISKLLQLICFAGIMAILVGGTGCCAPIRYDNDLVGKVVDGKTGEPIPDTVIIGLWRKRHVTLAGGHSEYYDALETVANQQGEFRLHGKGFRLFTNIKPVQATVFKAGYDYIAIDYKSLSEIGGIVKLWEIDKDRMRERFPSIMVPLEKSRAYIKEENKAREMIGLSIYKLEE